MQLRDLDKPCEHFVPETGAWQCDANWCTRGAAVTIDYQAAREALYQLDTYRHVLSDPEMHTTSRAVVDAALGVDDE